MSKSYYDSVAKHIIHSTPPPYKGLKVDITELEEYPKVVFIVLYDYNIAEFNDTQIADITEWLNGLLKKLNSHALVRGKYAMYISTEESRSQ